ncbi:MAG: hypothetical protein ACOYI3_02775 [Christensenellales bacterium]|jgi:hypothetical protein
MKRYRRRRDSGALSLVIGIVVIAAVTAGLFFGIRALIGLFSRGTPVVSETPTPLPVTTPTPVPTPTATVALPEAEREPSEFDLYQLDIRVDVENNELTCMQQVDWTNRTGEEIGEAVFRMYPNALTHGEDSPVLNLNKVFPNGADTMGLEISRVLVNGTAVNWTLDGKLGTTLRVPFDEPLANDDSAEITLSYRFKLPKGFYPLSYSATGIQAAWFYPVSAVYADGKWALTDVAQSGAYPWYFPAADYEAVIRIAGKYALCSTGEAQNVSKQGDDTMYFISASAARDFAFCVTKHEKSAEKTTKSGVHVLARAQYNDRSRDLANTAAELIEFYEDYLGPFPGGELELVQTTMTGENSVHAGLIMVDTTLFSGKKAEMDTKLAYAVARQWLGCSVGAGFADDRDLLTPMAQFMAYLYLDQTNSASADNALALPGAKTMKDLRTAVGTSRFDPALKALCEEYAGKKCTAEDFAALCGDSEAEVKRALGR